MDYSHTSVPPTQVIHVLVAPVTDMVALVELRALQETRPPVDCTSASISYSIPGSEANPRSLRVLESWHVMFGDVGSNESSNEKAYVTPGRVPLEVVLRCWEHAWIGFEQKVSLIIALHKSPYPWKFEKHTE